MNEILFLVIGFIIGVIVTAVAVKTMIDGRKGRKLDTGKANRVMSVALGALMVGVFLLSASPTFAQTPVPITIPTDVIFTEANNWIEVFAPIAAIGIGISIALAVLGYLGRMIQGAFK